MYNSSSNLVDSVENKLMVEYRNIICGVYFKRMVFVLQSGTKFKRASRTAEFYSEWNREVVFICCLYKFIQNYFGLESKDFYHFEIRSSKPLDSKTLKT